MAATMTARKAGKARTATTARAYTTTKVSALPTCSLCERQQAGYDAAMTFGGWAYACEGCFRRYGMGLGLGQGQRLVLR